LRLEVGVGFRERGKYSFRPRAAGSDVVYVDVRPPEFEVGSPWVVADAQHLPFRDGIFEEVYASHLIEHLSDPARFLREARRVLRRGGEVILWTPNFLSRNAYLDPDHKHVFNVFKIRRMLVGAGLRPHYGANVGNRIPRFIRVILKLVFLVLCDELCVIGEKA